AQGRRGEVIHWSLQFDFCYESLILEGSRPVYDFREDPPAGLWWVFSRLLLIGRSHRCPRRRLRQLAADQQPERVSDGSLLALGKLLKSPALFNTNLQREHFVSDHWFPPCW